MNESEYLSQDATGLAHLIATGNVSAEEVLDAALARTDKVNGSINAVIADLSEHARDTIASGLPEGPFRGVPFLLKDLSAQLRGHATTQGSRFFAGHRAEADTTMVARYKAAGLVICGKSNTPELGLSASTEPVLFGPTRNPWNTQHSPGGSSGGSAAAVAAGIVPAAHATDGGGSIRIPASCCGLVGLKPTRGRNPLGPLRLEGWGGLSSAHVVTRTVRDCAALLDCTAGPEIGSPYRAPPEPKSYVDLLSSPIPPLRVALWTKRFDGGSCDAEVVAVAERVALQLEQLGHHIEIAGPSLDFGELARAHGVVASCHVAATLNEHARITGLSLASPPLEAATWRLYQQSHGISGADCAAAATCIHRAGFVVDQLLTTFDILVTPTLPRLPPMLNELDMSSDDADLFSTNMASMIAFTSLFNDSGHPAISLPLGLCQGLPVGVQFVSGFGRESLLLALAMSFENNGDFSTPRIAIADQFV